MATMTFVNWFSSIANARLPSSPLQARFATCASFVPASRSHRLETIVSSRKFGLPNISLSFPDPKPRSKRLPPSSTEPTISPAPPNRPSGKSNCLCSIRLFQRPAARFAVRSVRPFLFESALLRCRLCSRPFEPVTSLLRRSVHSFHSYRTRRHSRLAAPLLSRRLPSVLLQNRRQPVREGRALQTPPFLSGCYHPLRHRRHRRLRYLGLTLFVAPYRHCLSA